MVHGDFIHRKAASNNSTEPVRLVGRLVGRRLVERLIVALVLEVCNSFRIKMMIMYQGGSDTMLVSIYFCLYIFLYEEDVNCS